MAPRSRSTFTLDDQLCFALYDASRAVISAYRGRLAAVGLTCPLVRRLGERGAVRRTRSAADERVVDVTLTQAGMDLYERCRVIQAEVEELTGLSPDALGPVRGELHALSDRLRAPTTRSASG